MEMINTAIPTHSIENILCKILDILQQQKPTIQTNIVTQKDLLAMLQISPNTLKVWEQHGLPRLVPPIEGTRTVFYNLTDVITFLSE